MKLDPNSSQPPYRQLAELLADRIRKGEYAPGSALPSGAELASEVGVSRVTVQNALKVLKADGMVVGRQGSGVFVRDAPAVRDVLVQAQDGSLPITLDFYGYTALQIAERLGALPPLVSGLKRMDVRVIVDAGALWQFNARVDEAPQQEWPPALRTIHAAVVGSGVRAGHIDVISALTAPGGEFQVLSAKGEGHEIAVVAQGTRVVYHRTFANPTSEWFEQEWRALGNELDVDFGRYVDSMGDHPDE